VRFSLSRFTTAAEVEAAARAAARAAGAMGEAATAPALSTN
jgi:cysteine sulfinate desulfinase/cysteine desulfurase-like protein